MKKKLLTLLALSLAAVGFALCAGTGCASMTTDQKIALAGAESGNIYATAELTKAATPAAKQATIKALTDLATELPLIPLGKVSTFNIGALQAELANVHATLISNPAAANQIDSFIALVANNQGTLTSGIVTTEQALVFGAFQNVATGITNAIQFAAGQASVAAPVQ